MKKNQSPKTPDEPFYADIDAHVGNTGWCSAALIGWLTLIFLIIGGVMIVSWVQPTSSGSRISTGLLTRLHVNLPQVAADKRQATTFTAHIDDADLNEMLRRTSLSGVKDTQAHIQPKQIELRGTTDTGLSLPVFVAFRPKAVNEKIEIEVLEATVSGVRVLPLVNQAMRQAIADGIENVVGAQVSGSITAVNLGEAQMTVIVQPKVSNE